MKIPFQPSAKWWFNKIFTRKSFENNIYKRAPAKRRIVAAYFWATFVFPSSNAIQIEINLGMGEIFASGRAQMWFMSSIEFMAASTWHSTFLALFCVCAFWVANKRRVTPPAALVCVALDSREANSASASIKLFVSIKRGGFKRTAPSRYKSFCKVKNSHVISTKRF